MTVDPGGVSGVARGEFRSVGTETGSGLGSLTDCLRSGVGVETWEVEGPSWSQAWEIAGEFVDWSAGLVVSGIPTCDIHLVFERFDLRQRSVDLSPVAVTAGVETLLVEGRWRGVLAGYRLDLGFGQGQTPADAKRFGTSDRLQEWGLWGLSVGSAHRRDAARHLALRVARVLNGEV